MTDINDRILSELQLMRVAMEKIAASGKPLSVGAPKTAGGPGTFPPFGNSAGQPIRGAMIKDLEFYAGSARKSIADPARSKFIVNNLTLLSTIEDEIARQGGVVLQPPDSDAPF